MTRWQGTIRGMGFLPQAWPTARARLGFSQAPGQILVGDGFSKRNFTQFLPDPELEGGAPEVQGHIVKGKGETLEKISPNSLWRR